jgi:hypothetical protein
MANDADQPRKPFTGGSIRSVQNCTEPITVNVPAGQREYFWHAGLAITMMHVSEDGHCEIKTKYAPRKAFLAKIEFDATGQIVASFIDMTEITEPAQLQRRYPLGQRELGVIAKADEGPVLVFLNTVSTDIRLSAEACLQAEQALERS